jgi:hypothetical protein
VFLHVFAHVNAHDRMAGVEEELGQLLAELCFAHAFMKKSQVSGEKWSTKSSLQNVVPFFLSRFLSLSHSLPPSLTLSLSQTHTHQSVRGIRRSREGERWVRGQHEQSAQRCSHSQSPLSVPQHSEREPLPCAEASPVKHVRLTQGMKKMVRETIPAHPIKGCPLGYLWKHQHEKNRTI